MEDFYGNNMIQETSCEDSTTEGKKLRKRAQRYGESIKPYRRADSRNKGNG